MPFSELRGKNVLVTGGGGFIGSHLVDALIRHGASPRVLDNFATGDRRNLAAAGETAELIEGDLRDPKVCQRACQGVAVVFHQAALGSVPRSLEDPATTFDVNVHGTARLFDAARRAGVRRIVYASSSSVYGDSSRLPKREGEEGEPLSPYALSKRMNEDLARSFERCYDLQLLGLRYFNVYGPRQNPDGPYAAVIPRFLRAALSGRAPTIHGDGEQSRDFTFVGDAVRANLLAAVAPYPDGERVYNVAGGRRASILELARQIREVAGGPEPQHEAPRVGDVRHSLADISRAADVLDYRATIPLPQGLAETLLAYRESPERYGLPAEIRTTP